MRVGAGTVASRTDRCKLDRDIPESCVGAGRMIKAVPK